MITAGNKRIIIGITGASGSVYGQALLNKIVQMKDQVQETVIIFSEKELSSSSCIELFNLAMITGKLGKTSNGLVSLKEKNNSQGLFDMGIHEQLGPGGIPIDNESLIERLKVKWGTDHIPVEQHDLLQLLDDGKIRNLFIFGEDPLGCALNGEVTGWFSKAGFKVVQDYFMTPTAMEADLILPASFPAETGGSFTNSQRVIQEFDAVLPLKTGKSNLGQLTDLLKTFGFDGLSLRDYIFEEIISLLPQGKDHSAIPMQYTVENDDPHFFAHGCDAVVRIFDQEFNDKFIDKI